MDRAFDIFHPLVARWAASALRVPTPVQRDAWPVIARGEHVLATAPTGSGKTLTAFLWALNQLASGAWESGATRVLYVSPLKALNNDIRENLLQPLEELSRTFAEAGAAFPAIRVFTRSGDTPQDERRRMLRRPPEILITTPESLNLLLSARQARPLLQTLQTVILDEIHAVAGTKRGAHLMTAVERLTLLAGEFQRIALSATVRPLETVAESVGGYRLESSADIGAEPRYKARTVRIVAPPALKRYELAVRATPQPRDEAQESFWRPIVQDLAERIRQNRSTLVFTNNRRLCEKIALMLNHDVGGLRVYAHHGSLSRETRTVVEQRLKAGDLDGIIATNSLELGIDIGALDEVLLVQTPPSVASTLQRIGRAGHQVGAVSRALLYPTFGRDFLEAAAMAKAALEQDIEPLQPVHHPLDLLAQVMISMTAMERWDADRLYAFIRCASSYRELPRAQFDAVIEMLAGRYGAGRIRELHAMISFDQVNNTLEARPGALQTLYRSGGTIADRGYYTLRRNDSGAKVGELDEEFVWERNVGDAFTLASQSWRIERITHNDVFVVPAKANLAFVPFWRADEQHRKYHLSERLGIFCEAAEDLLRRGGLRERLMREHHLEPAAADELVEYLKYQRAVTNAPLPHRHHVLVEVSAQLDSGSDARQIIIHTLWGGALNHPYALAIARAWEDRFDQRLEIYSHNDAIALFVPAHITPDEVMALVIADTVEALLRRRLAQSGVFGARFREAAGVALILTREKFNTRLPLWLNRMRAKKLLETVQEYEDFPLIVEAWRACLQDEFELTQLQARLREMERGTIAVSIAHTSSPSPFAEGLVWRQTNAYMYRDDSPESPVEGRVSDSFWQELLRSSALRPRIRVDLVRRFEAKAQRVAPGYAPASTQELIDWVRERVLLTATEWEALLNAARRSGDIDEVALAERIVMLTDASRSWRVHIETWWRLEALGPDVLTANLAETVAVPAQRAPEDVADLSGILGEWLRFYGPLAHAQLAVQLPFRPRALEEAIQVLADEDEVIIDRLTIDAPEPEVCDTENLEILLRLLRAAARPQFEPQPLTRLPLFLAVQQRLGAEESGPEAVRQAVEALFGWCMPAPALESYLLPARVAQYVPADLDTLAQENGLEWWGCGKERICVGFQEQRALLELEPADIPPDLLELLPDAHARYSLNDILTRTGLNSSTVTKRLWEAAWSGFATNDALGALRQGIRTRFKPLDAPQPLAPRRGFHRWRTGRPFAGHWHRLAAVEPPEDALDALELEKERARLLLDRYGIVFRELLAQELPALRWSSVFRALRIMELAGEVVAGNFFDGIPGLQFISPLALARLERGLPEDHGYWLNAADPASLCGTELPELKGTLPRRVPGNFLLYYGTRQVLTVERQGKHLHVHLSPEATELTRVARLLPPLFKAVARTHSHVRIETINSQRAAESPYVDWLRTAMRVEVEPQGVAVWM